MRETLKQPNGSTVYIDAIPESGSCYSNENGHYQIPLNEPRKIKKNYF